MADDCGCKKENLDEKPSFFNSTFWDLWLQKIFRNFASMKFQWMVILCSIVVYGMFFRTMPGDPKVPLISASLGMTFLGGGFITLATSRIIARTKLTEPSDDKFDTDK